MQGVQQLALAPVIGFVLNIMGGYLGLGGCAVMLPAVLMIIFKEPVPVAVGTTALAVLISASIITTRAGLRMIDRRSMLVLGAWGALGAAIGDLLYAAAARKPWVLLLSLSAVFAYAAFGMVWETVRGARVLAGRQLARRMPGGAVAKSLLGLVDGFGAGFLGLGTCIVIPVSIYVLGAEPGVAVMTAMSSLVWAVLVSSAQKLAIGAASVVDAVLLAVGIIVGAVVGARLVPRTPGWAVVRLRQLFAIIFAAVSVKLLLSGLALMHAG